MADFSLEKISFLPFSRRDPPPFWKLTPFSPLADFSHCFGLIGDGARDVFACSHLTPIGVFLVLFGLSLASRRSADRTIESYHPFTFSIAPRGAMR